MAKRILVFVGDRSSSGEQFARKINAISPDEYKIVRYGDVVVSILQGRVAITDIEGRDIFEGCDLVYLRGISSAPLRHVLASYLSYVGIPLINSESFQYQYMTKLEQYVALALAGVPIPDSVFAGRSEGYLRIPHLLNTDMPIVAKSINGSNGNDNILIRDESELTDLDLPDPIFQPFIPNEFDYRVIVANNEVALAYKRLRNVTLSSYKNNIGQGGRREMVELPHHLHEVAIKAAHTLGRELAGLDIMPVENGKSHVVLEVNFNFGTPKFDDNEQEKRYYEKLANHFHKLAN